MMVLAMIGIGRGAWARPELEKLEAGEPGNPLYSYWLARLDYDGRAYETAVRRLKAVTSAHPEFMRAWDNLGLSLEGAGQLNEAVESYRRAVELNRKQSPPSPWPPLNLGTLLTKMDHLNEANDLLLEALQYDGQLAGAHYRLGANLHKFKRDAEAVEELRLAAKLAPEDPEPLYLLGRIYRLQGKTDEAAQIFAQYKVLRRKKRGEPPAEVP
jgi:tetratricopeptide (TPR) repeat protein